MRFLRRTSAIDRVPTITDGRPPEPEVQDQVIENQARAAAQWEETGRDMLLNDLAQAREARQQMLWQVVALAVAAIAIAIVGWRWATDLHAQDQMVRAQSRAAEQKPYQPFTLNQQK